MNQRFSYYLNVVLAIGLFLVVFKYGCKPKYIDTPLVVDIVDSNAIYDHIDSEYGGKIIILYDSIDNLNKRLKSTRAKFKENYGAIIVKVGKNLENNEPIGIDSNCLITLDYANETINQQDSIIEIQSRGLDACNSQVVNLRNQVEWNEKQNTILTKNVYKLSTENQNLEIKVKRNRLFAGIVSAILFSFVLIK